MRNLTARRRERRKREPPTGELQLAAMVDMMINLLLFLLNLYGSSTNAVQPSEELVFAPSSETAPVRFAPTVVVAHSEVRVGETVVGTWSRDERAPDASELDSLRAAMQELPRSDKGGELLVQIDRRVPWASVSPVLAAAGELGFTDVRFAVASSSRAE